jgi:hypothetical protein
MSTQPILETARIFRRTIESTHAKLAALTDDESARRPAPNKWSKKEIIGHLIDSASNNHQRFVRARFTTDLVFPGYEQAEWVEAQRYQLTRWRDLLDLWRAFNLHLAHVMETTPREELVRPRARHNLHEIAWQHVAPTEVVTLEWFMIDYVGHFEHHVAQVLR